MRIETVPVEQIDPAPYNPRRDLRPGDPAYEALSKSIDTFGYVEPLVWNMRTGHLVGGHQRLNILLERGVKTVQVSVVDLPPQREKALNLALNKIAGEWDRDLLARVLDDLIDVKDLDFTATGFDLGEARDIIAEVFGRDDDAEVFDIDAALASAGEPVTAPGDLIELGLDPKRSHRLLCGDCTDAGQVRRLMDGHRATLFATDPPYLVGYDGANHPGGKKGGRKGNKADSEVSWDDASANPELYERFIGAAVAEAITPNAAWYCWHASRRQAMLEAAWSKHDAFVHCQIVWVKNKGVPTRSWYLWAHEPCLMGWLRGNRPLRADANRLPTVWRIDTLANGPDRPDHPTPKPLEVFEIPMRQHTRASDICYEPFAGSGTQFIAAERLGRRCFGLEISPAYCDLIVRRFIAFAGEQAVTPETAEKYRQSQLEGVSTR